MPVINKDDFSAFDEALKSAPAAKTTTDEFSVFDEALKKNDGQDGGLEEDGTSPTQLESDSQLPLTEEKPPKKAEIIVEPTQDVKLESNPITLISDKTKTEREYADALANENMVGASEAQKKLDKIDFELKATGIDDKSKNDLNKELFDFPWEKNITKKKIEFEPEKYGLPIGEYSLPKILSVTREKDYPAYLRYLAQYKIGDLIEKNTGDIKGEVNDFLYTFKGGEKNFSKGVAGLQEIEDYANVLKQNVRKNIGVDNLGVEKKDTKKALGLIDEYTSSLIYNNYDEKEAKEFLQGKLNDTDLDLKQTNTQEDVIKYGVREDGTVNYPKYTSDIDLDNFNLSSIASKLDLNNPAIKTAYDVYARKVGLDNALGKVVTPPGEPPIYNNGNEWIQEDFENAAINYESSQNPLIAKQLEEMGGRMPESMKGNIIQSFLNNPDVIEAAKTNPSLAKIYNETRRGFRFKYPEANETRISTIISQGLEDMGETNWLVNIPTQDQVDNVVQRLKQQGKLSDIDIQDYEKSIRNDIGVLMSVYRGLGRIPFGAFIPESKLKTAGVLENFQNEFNSQISGYAKSIEDLTPGMDNVTGGTGQRLYNILSKNATNVNLNLTGAHEIAAGTGHILGFVVPFAMGGEVLSGVKGGHYINSILAFEGHNRDRAIELFPGDAKKQVGYTLAATAGDALIGELLPTKAIAKSVSNAFKKDTKIIINNLLDGKITQNEAILKLNKLPNQIITFLGKNANTTAVMTAFGLYKESIAKAFGGANQDKSYTELAYEAVNGAKTTFLTTPVLTLLEMRGVGTGSNKANHKVLWEVANDPAKYEKIINDEALTNPTIASQKEEMLNNLNLATTVVKELNESGIDITNEQKQKYLSLKLKENIWMRKAATTSDPNISQKYMEKATEYKNSQKEILDNKDKADELNNYDIAEDEIVENVPGEEVPVLTSEEAFKGISEEQTGYVQDVVDRINKNESINEGELKDAEDILYTAYDNNPEAASFIEPVIIKIQNHENVTKTETVQTTEKQPIEGTFGARQKIKIKPALQQSEGSTARVVLADGTEGEGTLKVKNGNYVIEVKGQEPIVIGEKAVTDRDLKAPEGESPIELDENGNVKSATFETKDGHKVTITDPEKALDLGIQLRLETIGEIPDEAFDKAYEDVVKETQVEVPIERLKVEKKVETEVEVPEQKEKNERENTKSKIKELPDERFDEVKKKSGYGAREVVTDAKIANDYHDALKIPETKRTEKQNKIVKTVNEVLGTKKTSEVTKKAKGKAAKFVAEYIEKREVEEGEPIGAVPTQTHTVETIDQVDTTGFNEVQKKNVSDAKRILKVISKLVGKETGKKLKLIIHSTRESAAKAVYDSTIKAGGTEADAKANMQNQGNRGWWSSADGEIHLNIAEVASETIKHEVTHPILDAIAKVRPEIIDQFYKQLESLPEAKGITDLAEENYANRNEDGKILNPSVVKTEAITDYIAKVADGQIKIDKSNFEKVKDYIVNLLTKIGLAPEKDIRSIEDLRKLAQTISEKFAKGDEINIKDGAVANSSQRVQFQSDFKHKESGIEWKYFKNSKEFQKLVDEGYVTFDKNIDDFSGAVVLHAPDAAFSGQILKDGVLVANGKGGMYYPLVFHENGDFWAATERGAASLAKTLNEARAKSPDGKVKMILISSPVDKLMSSSLNGIGLVDILTSKAFSEKSGITPEQLRKAIISGIKVTEQLKSEGKDGMKPTQKPLPKLTGKESLSDLHIMLRDFYPAEKSDFPVRKSLNQNILDGIASYSSSSKVAKQLSDFLGLGSFNEKLKSTGGRLSRANLTQGFSNILAEPTLRGEQTGKMYAVIELGADVKPVRTPEHESYPFTLRSVDASQKATIHILKQRDFWYNHVKDETGKIVGENKDKQSTMLPSSAGISSVVELSPTKLEGISKKLEKAKPQEPIREFGVGFAPYRDKNVTTLEQDKEMRKSLEVKFYQKMITDISNIIGVKLGGKIDTWGGYVDSETGLPVQEVSNVMEVTGTPSQMKLMAAVLGKAAPEMQNSILLGEYSSDGKGIEHTISTGNFENANKALNFLKANDLEYFSIDKKTGNVLILDQENTQQKNIDNFITQLNENGIKTEHTIQPVNAEFIYSDRYDEILSSEGGKIGDKNRGNLDAVIKKAGEVYKKINEKKVEQLRADEKAEYDAMLNPKDEVKRKEIYDKYDKLITPLLKESGLPKQEGIQLSKKKKESVEATTKALEDNFKKDANNYTSIIKTENTITNKEGNPIVFYHGTGSEFKKFDVKKLGTNTQAESAKEGIFFTDSKDVADTYLTAEKTRTENYNPKPLEKSLKTLSIEEINEIDKTILKHYGKYEASEKEDAIEDILYEIRKDTEHIYQDRKHLLEKLTKHLKQKGVDYSPWQNEGMMVKVILDAKKVKTIDAENSWADDINLTEKLKQYKAEGYDAVLVENVYDSIALDENMKALDVNPSTLGIVFNTKNIKRIDSEYLSEEYHNILKVPEEKRTEKQKQLVSSVNEALGISELPKQEKEGVGEVETVKAVEPYKQVIKGTLRDEELKPILEANLDYFKEVKKGTIGVRSVEFGKEDGITYMDTFDTVGDKGVRYYVTENNKFNINKPSLKIEKGAPKELGKAKGWSQEGNVYTNNDTKYSIVFDKELGEKGLYQVLDSEGFDPIGEGFNDIKTAKKAADEQYIVDKEFEEENLPQQKDVEETKSKTYIRDKRGNYYPKNTDLPQGFLITQNYENNEGEGVLYDQYGYRIMEGNIWEIEEVLKKSYPIGTPEIKDGTNLDLYRNIDKFTLKQFETILQNLDPEGDWDTMVKEVDGQPNEYSARMLETSLLKESREKLKEFTTDMLKADGADEYIGFDIPKDGLGKTELPMFSKSKDKKISDMKDILKEYVDEGKSLNEIKEIMKDEFGDYYKDVEGVIEQAHQEMTTTAIKNAVTERERAERGLTEVEVEAKRSFGKVFDDAKDMVANGEANGLTLAAEIVKNPRPLKAEESAVLLIDRMRISNEYNRKNAELLKAQQNKETEKADIIESQLEVLEQEMDLNDEAARKSGYEQGLGLAARRMLIAQDYSLATQMSRLKAANGGKEVPKQYQEQLKDLITKLDEANKKLERFEKNQAGTEKQKQLGKVKPVSRTPEQTAKEKSNIKSKILAKWGQTLARMKAASGNIKRSVSGAPITPEKKAQLESIVKDVNDMVKLYAELGETNLKTIINEIHKDLVGDIPDLNKSDIENIVLGEYDVEKVKTPLTKEKIEAQANVRKVKTQIDLLKEELKNKQRSGVEKGVDYIHGWHRFAILSGAPSAAKIGTAALTRGIVTRGENILGQALSLIPGIRQIAKKAPRHGSMSATAEAKAFTTWFDKMTIDDVRETMKTGMSSIDYNYGKKEPMGGKVPEWMEFFGRMHSAIKLLPKRAEFFRSLQSRTEHALANGKDVNDPMVQQEMASAAYNDAIRAIFMQDNPISSSYTKLVNGLEKDYPAFASVMKFIFPIVKVPVNYVSEQVSYLPPIAAVKMVTTLYKGREGMSEEQADYFMRALKKGAIGTAFIFMGFMNPQALGGYYTGKRKEDELEAGDIKLFGVKLPHFMTHTPLLEMLQVGATMRRASDAKIAKGEEPTKFDGIPAIFKGEMTQIPFIGTGQRVMKLADNKTTDGFKDYVYSMGQSILEPQLMQNIADWTDKKEGETVKRKPEGFVDKLKEGVPGLRKTLKEEDNLKLNKKEQEEYSGLIEKGINIPELNRRTSYRVKNDEQHPDSHMTEDEFTKFISLQKEFANKSYKEYYLEHTELLDRLQKMIDAVPDTPKEKSELNKLKDKIQNRIDAIHNRAIDKAKRKLHLK